MQDRSGAPNVPGEPNSGRRRLCRLATRNCYTVRSAAGRSGRFIFEFDATVQMQETNKYEENLLPYMQDFLAAYKLGLQDGTVKEIENVELYYLTTTHAIMGLCKKLTMNSVVLDQDKNGKEEVKILIETIIYRLKNNK